MPRRDSLIQNIYGKKSAVYNFEFVSGFLVKICNQLGRKNSYIYGFKKLKLLFQGKKLNIGKNKMEKTNILGLTPQQTSLMFSLQHFIVLQDIKNEKDNDKKLLKQKWLSTWENNMNVFLSTISQNKSNKISILENDTNKLVKSIRSELKNFQIPLYLILLESVLFIPYFAFNDASENLNKKYTRLKLDEEIQNQTLRHIASKLNISTEYIQIFQKSYKEAQNRLTGFWKKVLFGGLIGTVLIALSAGFAAPFIGSIFAVSGLSGAAAISAGLAALGGGAIAAGGFGMAGGIAVIVGGGAILGAASGSTAGALMATSPDFTLSQAAKLEVVMQEIVLGAQKDTRFAQEIIKKQRQAIQNTEKELDNLKMQSHADKKKIENLSKSIEYLKKALQQNIEFVKVEKN